MSYQDEKRLFFHSFQRIFCILLHIRKCIINKHTKLKSNTFLAILLFERSQRESWSSESWIFGNFQYITLEHPDGVSLQVRGVEAECNLTSWFDNSAWCTIIIDKYTSIEYVFFCLFVDMMNFVKWAKKRTPRIRYDWFDQANRFWFQ